MKTTRKVEKQKCIKKKNVFCFSHTKNIIDFKIVYIIYYGNTYLKHIQIKLIK